MRPPIRCGWTEDGHCTDILSIDKYGFYFVSEKMHCGRPVGMRLAKDTAVSTAYWLRSLLAANPTGQ